MKMKLLVNNQKTRLNVSKRIDNNITCNKNDNIYITNILEIYQ